MENILISLCLVGVDCKYSGGNNLISQLEKLQEKYNLIPFCPEITGGLTTPRPPCEINEGKVVTQKGIDHTREYQKGAQEALKLAQRFSCKRAILQVRSPSCGAGLIYDGTFSGTLVPGDGITAALFKDQGIEIIPSDAIDTLLLE